MIQSLYSLVLRISLIKIQAIKKFPIFTILNHEADTSLFFINSCYLQGFGQVDAGISSVNSPSGNICPGSITPSVTLENFGATTLTAVDILYNIDGAPNSSYSWSGSLTLWRCS